MSDNLELSDLSKTLLESGLVDDSMAQLLEKWKVLPDGATQFVDNDALKSATRQQLEHLVEKISDGVENHRTLRETYRDLDKLRWPKEVTIGNIKCIALVDRMGRFYFRVEDAARMSPGCLSPGKTILYDIPSPPTEGMHPHSWTFPLLVYRDIQEVTTLYIGPDPVAVQVSCGPEYRPALTDGSIGYGG